MKLSEAVAKRIRFLLNTKVKKTQYRLEKDIPMSHSTMMTIMGAKNDSLNLKSTFQIIRALNVTVSEFFDDPMFEDLDLEIY